MNEQVQVSADAILKPVCSARLNKSLTYAERQRVDIAVRPLLKQYANQCWAIKDNDTLEMQVELEVLGRLYDWVWVAHAELAVARRSVAKRVVVKLAQTVEDQQPGRLERLVKTLLKNARGQV